MTKDILDEILDSLRIDTKPQTQVGTNPYNPPTLVFVDGKAEAKAAILKHYLPIDQVKEAIGEMELEYTTRGNVNSMGIRTGRNQLRKEIKERLKIE